MSLRQDEPEDLLLFQILEQPRRAHVVETFDYSAEDAVKLWTVQRLALWTGGEPTQEATQLDAFVVESPERADLVALMGSTVASRDKLRTWRPALSDVEGCKRHARKVGVQKAIVIKRCAHLVIDRRS